MADKTDGIGSSYRPSASTGVFGSYTIKAVAESQDVGRCFEYRASNSTGVFGSFTIGGFENINEDEYGDEIADYLETCSTWKPQNKTDGYGVKKIGCWTFRNEKNSNDKSNDKSKEKNKEKNSSESESDKRQENRENMEKKDDEKNDTLFYVCRGSVVSFSGEAIVNAANEGCLGGGGVDGAITSAGGPKLDDLRRALPTIKNTHRKRCLTGSAVITGSGYGTKWNKLKCKYVIHAVGPNYMVRMRSANPNSRKDPFEECDRLLYDCYKKCMQLGEKYGIKSIGFCLISSGIFRGPQSLDKVLEIGCQAIYDNIYQECQEIFMIGFKREELDTLLNVTPKVFGPPKEMYQQQKRSQASALSFSTVKGFSGKLWNKISGK